MTTPSLTFVAKLRATGMRVLTGAIYATTSARNDLFRTLSRLMESMQNNEPIVVKLDESQYFHRKYHQGQWCDGHWAFGGVERASGECFHVEVPNWREETLSDITVQ